VDRGDRRIEAQRAGDGMLAAAGAEEEDSHGGLPYPPGPPAGTNGTIREAGPSTGDNLEEDFGLTSSAKGGGRHE
jgi:hypothetical protein